MTTREGWAGGGILGKGVCGGGICHFQCAAFLRGHLLLLLRLAFGYAAAAAVLAANVWSWAAVD